MPAWWIPLVGYGAYKGINALFGGGGRDASYSRPEITNPPVLSEQLEQYDQGFGPWFENARAAYARGVKTTAGAQYRGQLRNVQQSMANVAGVPFSGYGANVEAQMRMAQAANVTAALADFDTKINQMIAQGRIQATLGHFDYMRNLALMERQGQLQWDIEQYRWDMYQDIATKQAWFDFFGNIFGAAIGNLEELKMMFLPGATAAGGGAGTNLTGWENAG